MFRSLIRAFSSSQKLHKLNREMHFEDVKTLYEQERFTDPIEAINCKKEYLYALKYMNLLEEDKSSEIPQNDIIVEKVFTSKINYSSLIYTIHTGLIIYLGYIIFTKNTEGGGSDFSSLLDSTEHIHSTNCSNVSFKDVRGIDDCREELEDIVSFLKNPELYQNAGAQMIKGVLLTGKPGTGKTLLAKAIAGEAGVTFFYCSGSEFDEMFVGMGAKRVRSLFAEAKKKAPAIIFIDEIDALASNRGSLAGMYTKQSLNQLLTEMDGFSTKEKIIVIAATNFPESLDKAIKRSGRFDKEINIPVPDRKGRGEILDLYLSRIKKDESVDKEAIISKTMGMTGAEISNVVNLAALNAVKAGRVLCLPDDFEQAIDRIKIGLVSRTYTMTESEKMCTVYHELGHAIVGYFTEGAAKLHKVTILPRGQSLGHTSILDSKEDKHRQRAELLANIDVCMGGRAAEEIFFGPENVSSGCSSDLRNATTTCYDAIKAGLFSDKLGVKAYNNIDELGEDERNKIDCLAKEILEESYMRAKKMIKNKIKLVEKLAIELLAKETLTREEFTEIVESI